MTNFCGWKDPHTAEQYAAFASSHEMYRRTSTDLVSRLDLTPDSRVLDLCAGTGVTTAALLERLGQNASVVAVDASPAMLAQGRRRVTDPRVRWVESKAEELAERVEGHVDAVVCNSAIWQTDIAATFAAVRKILRPGGTFICNIPRGFLVMPFTVEESDGTTPSLVELMAAFAAIELNYSAPLRARRGGQPMTPESVNRALVDAGLSAADTEPVTFTQTPAEELAWLRIPIFTERLFPGLGYPTRMRLLDAAQSHAPRTESQLSTWVVFSATA